MNAVAHRTPRAHEAVAAAAPLSPVAPCREAGIDLDLWFAEKPTDLAVAQAVCSGCVLRDACLDEAVRRREPWGVWGGAIFVDGIVVQTKRGRGRPRKGVAATSTVPRP